MKVIYLNHNTNTKVVFRKGYLQKSIWWLFYKPFGFRTGVPNLKGIKQAKNLKIINTEFEMDTKIYQNITFRMQYLNN